MTLSNINPVEIKLYKTSKTTTLVDKIFDKEKQYTHALIEPVVFIIPEHKEIYDYRIKIVTVFNDSEIDCEECAPEYYYTMTDLKKGYYLKFSDGKDRRKIYDYDMFYEIGDYFAKEKIELQTLIPFWGSYEIHCQGTSEYQQGGWGNFDDLTLYAIGFILEKGPCNFGAMVL